MQAIYIDPNLLKKELSAENLEVGCSESILRTGINHTLKLRGIPESALRDLIKAVEESSALICCYRPEKGSQGSAFLTGSRIVLQNLSAALAQHSEDLARLGEIIADTTMKALKTEFTEISLGSHRFRIGENTLIMGILNVTPDSFSDGGRFHRIENALARAYKMAEDGADIIDIGGESTRPGYEKAGRVTAAEELERVMPVITALKSDQSFKLPISIDTYKAETAEKALNAGVEMLNDVWGLKEDQQIAAVAASYGVPVCLMHNRRNTDYIELIADIIFELEESVELARRAGIDDSKIILDPGIGFGKDYQQNLEVMHHLKEIRDLGFPLLLGTSRKSIVGKTLNLPADDRIEGTAATISCSIVGGADIVRVHDVKQMKRVAVMTDAIVRR